MNKIHYTVLTFIILISVTACKVKKVEPVQGSQKIEISKEEQEKMKLIDGIQNAHFNYDFITAKAKVKVNRTGNDFNLTFNIRAKKDEKIWISANAIGGIEVARVLLTKDSVKILDRIQKRYISSDYKYLTSLLNITVDFSTMQDLMFGNAPRNIDYQKSDILQNENALQFNGMLSKMAYSIDLRKEDYRLQRISMSEAESKRNVIVNYGDYKMLDVSTFPYLISSTAISQKESLSLNLEYVKVEKVNTLEFPFNVPKNFE